MQTVRSRIAHYKTQCLCLILGYLSELHGERFPTPEEDEWPRLEKYDSESFLSDTI